MLNATSPFLSLFKVYRKPSHAMQRDTMQDRCSSHFRPNICPIIPYSHLHPHPSSPLPQQPPPHPRINHTPHPIRRNHTPHPRRRRSRPVPPNPPPSIPPPNPGPLPPITLTAHSPRPIIQIQPQQMQRRTQDLHPRRRQKLRRVLRSNHRSQQGWDIEAREYG